MAEQEKTNPQIRLMGQVAMSSALWAASFVATKSEWLTRPDSLAVRGAVVAIGVGGFLPVVYVYVKSIRMQDEFNQRVHLVSLACAFAATAVVSYTSDLLFQAGFIPQLPATGLWALMIAIWFVAMIVTPRHYQ
jgi:hypothetical protein